ncbi:hypothetical protein G9A89_003607 [Geosiphon pyriformis]|nr:hypothetical protein G9A89_003607 [Geosiphon pyriformis]
MKKSVKNFSVDTVSKDVASRKKRKEGVLKDGIVHKKVLSGNLVGSSWRSEAGNTTELDSVDMEKKFLVEETSVNYGERVVLKGKDNNQMPKSPKLVTKQALGKLLGKINFLGSNDDDGILLDESVVLFFSLKKLINMSAKKSFALDINLINISEKSAQDKLVVIRKLFSKINGFGRASTPLKFSGIIQAMFTSKSSLMKATKLAANVKILVNTDLKKLSGHSDRAVVLKKIPVRTSAEAVHTALSKFGIIKSIKMQLHRVLLYTLPMGTNVHNIWNFIGSVNEKTCVIDCHPVTYARTRCATVCFESAESLNAVMRTTPVFKGAHLYWSYLGSATCAKCEKLGHFSLNCVSGRVSFFSSMPRRVLSDIDKSKLAAIYAKCSASVARPVSFGGVSWAKIPTLSVMSDLEKKFTVLESSIVSLAGQIGELAKRLDSFMLAVFQPSSGCQLLVTPLSQNQVGNIVMGEGSGEATSGNTAAILVFSVSPEMKKLENMLEGLSTLVLSLTARFDSSILDDVVCWHKDMDNLVSIFTESKLKGKVHPWIVNKFDGVWVFISGLDSGHLGAGVAVVMNNSLTKHVCKVFEVPS